jgi:hypothetical protein
VDFSATIVHPTAFPACFKSTLGALSSHLKRFLSTSRRNFRLIIDWLVGWLQQRSVGDDSTFLLSADYEATGLRHSTAVFGSLL